MTAEATQPAPVWVQAPIPEETAGLIENGLSSRLASLLARRGVQTAAAAGEFLEPSLAGLHDPHLMPGLSAAVERLLKAGHRREKVAIVGDYDVDGVSATALLVAVLRASHLEVEAILPERLQEGYGFQPVHVETAVRLGCSLVVTADCGSTAPDAAVSALAAGLDVIVTDHHLGAEVELPEEVIEINPHRPGSSYPFPDLSGAGVAYKLAVGLLAADYQGERIGIRASISDRPLRTVWRAARLSTIASIVTGRPRDTRSRPRPSARFWLSRVPAKKAPPKRPLWPRRESPISRYDSEKVAYSPWPVWILSHFLPILFRILSTCLY